jgi:hypothetical protein
MSGTGSQTNETELVTGVTAPQKSGTESATDATCSPMNAIGRPSSVIGLPNTGIRPSIAPRQTASPTPSTGSPRRDATPRRTEPKPRTIVPPAPTSALERRSIVTPRSPTVGRRRRSELLRPSTV